jgi:S-adenosylmethionine hydrolase
MARPVVALLTDFGTRDHYAGTMKGVILTICPDAALVDISHEIPPHDVLTAALELAAAYRYFPPGTIFLVVVDPGVGSARRGIAAETAEHRFVTPDNGVLTAVFRDAAPKRVVELTERRYARPTVSRTFEGRDRFAPAAAWLAKGVELSALGRPMSGYQRLEIPAPQLTDAAVTGQVLRIDRFGNLVTNIDRRTVETMAKAGSGIQIEAGTHTIARLVATYAEAAPGEVCALFGSTDHLEIAANAGNASEILRLQRGAPILVRRA